MENGFIVDGHKGMVQSCFYEGAALRFNIGIIIGDRVHYQSGVFIGEFIFDPVFEPQHATEEIQKVIVDNKEAIWKFIDGLTIY